MSYETDEADLKTRPTVGAETAEVQRPELVQKALGELLDELDVTFQELGALSRLGGAVDPDELLNRTLGRAYDVLRGLLPFDRIGLALMDDSGQRLRAVWVRSDAPVRLDVGYSEPLANTSLGKLLHEGKPRIIADLEDYLRGHPQSATAHELLAEGMRSSLTCPLRAANRQVGCIFFTSRHEGAYRESDIDVFQTLSQRLALMLERARLAREMLAFDQDTVEDLPREAVSPRATATVQISPPHLLICAGDPLVREICRRTLARGGHILQFCRPEDLDEAVGDKPPELAVLDLQGLTGSVTRDLDGRLARMGSNLLLLAAPAQSDRARALCTGRRGQRRDVVYRPLKPTELQGKVADLLSRRTPSLGAQGGEEVGEVFAERYRIVEEIGAGTYGVVYSARDLILPGEPEVALKIMNLTPSQLRDRRYTSLILREAYSHSRVDHPHIVRLLDFGHFGSSYFLAMEYLRGRSVADLLEAFGPLPQERLIPIALGIARALDYLASRQLVHRDVKPGNIIVTDDDQVKLLDFGLARDGAEDTLAPSGMIMATPAYVAPEMILREELDIRADVYSLGVTLYLAACGQLPFAGSDIHALIKQHLTVMPPPLGERATRIEGWFHKLVMAMLAKSRAKRPRPAQIIEVLEARARR